MSGDEIVSSRQLSDLLDDLEVEEDLSSVSTLPQTAATPLEPTPSQPSLIPSPFAEGGEEKLAVSGRVEEAFGGEEAKQSEAELRSSERLQDIVKMATTINSSSSPERKELFRFTLELNNKLTDIDRKLETLNRLPPTPGRQRRIDMTSQRRQRVSSEFDIIRLPFMTLQRFSGLRRLMLQTGSPIPAEMIRPPRGEL